MTGDAAKAIFHQIQQATGLLVFLDTKDYVGGERGWIAHFVGRLVYPVQIRAGYLGAYAVDREPRPGEDWVRGNDMADGPNESTTVERIISDINAMENEGRRAA